MDNDLKRALIAEADTRNQEEEAIELALLCAKDIVNAWPQTTIRTLSEMTKRMDTLRQALEAAGK